MPRRLIPDADTGGIFHLVSRVVDRRLIFEEPECRFFLRLTRAYAEFGGIKVITWCIMGNHFHLLVRVPPGSRKKAMSLSDGEVLRRISLIKSGAEFLRIQSAYDECEAASQQARLLEPYRQRMGSIANLMKGVKQRFSRWFNNRHDRCGTLWENRYHSVTIQGSPSDQVGLGYLPEIVAAYIDLNPVRAGLVGDASDYPWSAYGTACRGGQRAIAGLSELYGCDISKEDAVARHRQRLKEEWEAFRQRSGSLPSRASPLPLLSHTQILGTEEFVTGLAGPTPTGRAKMTTGVSTVVPRNDKDPASRNNRYVFLGRSCGTRRSVSRAASAPRE